MTRLLLSVLLASALTTAGCTTLERVFGFEEQVKAAQAKVRITGSIETEGPVEGTLVVVVGTPAFQEDGSPKLNPDGIRNHAGVDAYSRRNPGTFLFMIDPGSYRVGAYEDRNRNGMLDPGERVSPFQGAKLHELGPGDSAVIEIRLTDESIFEDEPVDILGLVERDVREQGLFVLGHATVKGEVVGDLSDDRFAQEQGAFGLWQPMDFLNKEWAGIYFLEEYDASRIPVLYVHGISGYPREFEQLIGDLDRSRFQPWLYFYPSGFGLDGISGHLANTLRELQIKHDFDELAIVAHSMGGLVARGAILKYFQDTLRDDVEIFISINSPFGGDVKAKSASNAPIRMPDSFQDMSPDSAYMTWVFYEDEERKVFKPLPADTPHHMIMGFNGSGSQCNDGAVSCESQSHPDLQEHAASVRSWNYTHVGTLQEARTIERVNGLLEDAF